MAKRGAPVDPGIAPARVLTISRCPTRPTAFILSTSMMVRTRFAPSPTGYLHVGGARTALFSWLYARHCGGRFILRIEDTDRERSTREAVNVLIDGLTWLGIDWDEGAYFQSERSALYREILERLLREDRAYRCYCTREELDAMRSQAMARGEKPKYDGRCRQRTGAPPAGVDPVIRLKSPLEGEVVVHDLIQGDVVYQNAELDDLILARSDGSPTFNFTVVVDDWKMDISHVIRGDDHLNNAARQMHIYNALGVAPPRFAHVPLILGPDGKKLSKRNGTVSVLEYGEAGYLPEALCNYLVRLGWSHADREIFSREEMIALFDIKDVNRAAAAINPEKLLWLNRHYLKSGEPVRLGDLLETHLRRIGVAPDGGPALAELAAVQCRRTKTLVDMAEQSRCFFEDFTAFDEIAARRHLQSAIAGPLAAVRERFASLPDWNNDVLRTALLEVAESAGLKIGRLAQPLRVAVTGTAVSPGIEDTLRLLGRDRTLRRIDRAIDRIRAQAPA